MSVYGDCWTLLCICILSLTFPVVSTSKQPLSAQTTTENHHYIKLFDVSNHTTKDVIRTKSNIQPCNEPTCLFTLFFGSISTNIQKKKKKKHTTTGLFSASYPRIFDAAETSLETVLASFFSFSCVVSLCFSILPRRLDAALQMRH